MGADADFYKLEDRCKRLRRDVTAVEKDRAWFAERYPSFTDAQRRFDAELVRLNGLLTEAEAAFAEAQRTRGVELA